MKFIIRKFIIHPEKYKNTCREPDRKTENINSRITFVSPKTTPCDLKIVFYHGYKFYSVLNDFTGFDMAALIVWEHIVIKPITPIIIIASKTNNQVLEIRKAKF